MAKVPKLVVGQWILRDLYEVVPSTYSSLVSGNFAWVQYYALAGITKITGIAWYRSRTDGDKPQTLTIWNRDLPVRLWKTDNAPDDGTVGWQEVDLSASPIYAVGYFQRYGAGAYSADGGVFSAADQSVTRQDQAPAAIPLQYAQNHSNGGDIQPDSPGTGRIYGLDLRVELANLEPATISADVDASLASYLTAAGSNYTGNPLADIKTTVEDTYNETQDAGHGLAAIKADTQSLLDRLTVAWRDTVASNTEGIPGFLTAWDAFYTQFVTITAPAVADLVEAIGDFTGISVLGYLAALIRFANGIDAPPQLAEGPDWEMVDETDFTNNLLWPVEADLYRVTLSAFKPEGTSEAVGSETRHAYLGKWCPFNVQFSSEWHYFNTDSADLYLGGRMPGLGLILNRPGAGHVQAWRRTETS